MVVRSMRAFLRDGSYKKMKMFALNKGLPENIAERLKVTTQARKKRKSEKENDDSHDPNVPDFVFSDDDESSSETDASSRCSFNSGASAPNSRPRKSLLRARHRLLLSPKHWNNTVLLNPSPVASPSEATRIIVSQSCSNSPDLDNGLHSNIRASDENESLDKLSPNTDASASMSKSPEKNILITITTEPTTQTPASPSASLSEPCTTPSPSKYTKKGELRRRRKFQKSVSERKDLKRAELVSTHHVRPACDPAKCVRKCSSKVSEEQRKFLNDEFWKMKTAKERKSFILHHISCTSPKQRTTSFGTESGFKRHKSMFYSFRNEAGTSVTVCKKFFLTTLGFEPSNDRIVRTALEGSNNSVSSSEDRRCRRTPHNKMNDKVICDHIETFSPELAHYRREHAPYRSYLPSDLTLTDMHKDFISNPGNFKCSYDKYRSVAAKMNVSFAKLGHEECEICEAFDLHNPDHKKDSLDETCAGCCKWEEHYKKYRAACEKYEEDAAHALQDGELIYCVDLQKVIMLPRLDMFKIVIFTCSYDECFVPVGKKKHCYPFVALWHEAINGSAKEDIISTFHQFLKSKRDYKKIIIWTDTCSAQNKNWAFISYLIYIVNSAEIEAIEIKIRYFEPGHTFMAADSFHKNVEDAMRKLKKLYDFNDFITAVRTAKQHTEVKEMKEDEFFEWPDYSSQYKLGKVTPRPYLSNMVEITVRRGTSNVIYKTSFDGDSFEMNFMQAKFTKHRSLQFPKPVECKITGFPATKNLH